MGFIFISHHLHSYSDKLKEDVALGITMVNYLALRQYHVYIQTSLPAAIVYVVYISQLIRYPIVCVSCQDFLDRGLLLARKLQNQGLIVVKLTSSLAYILRIKGFIFISHHLHSYSDKLKEDIALGITMVNYLALRQYHVYIQTVIAKIRYRLMYTFSKSKLII
jgi:phosphatidylserine decarboxylase